MHDPRPLPAGELDALRQRAEASFRSQDFQTADRSYEELHRLGALGPGDARQWVAALRQIGARRQEAPTLRQLAEEFPDEQDILEFVAAELWQRAEALAERAGPFTDQTLAREAWSTALKMAAPGPRDDEDGVRLIGLLDRFYQAGKRQRTPIGSPTEFEQALVRFAAAGPRSALRAADLLAADNPGLSLELITGTEQSAAAVLVQAVASCELDDFGRAAELFDELERVWGTAVLDLDVEDRSHWIQAMTDVGRFEEAEHACGETLGALELEPRVESTWTVTGLTSESLDHWRHSYRLLAYRLAAQQGRFREAWDHLRASTLVREDNLGPELRRSILRVRLLFADQREGLRILAELGELAALDPFDMTYAEACLWAGTQWGTPAAEGQETSPSNPFADARYRGQAAARAILARAGTTLGSRQQLRAALLAGDDDRAARILGREPLTESDPWSVKVLGAVLALRRGEDALADNLIQQVLPQRRHDIDLRVLDAQSSLIAGEYKVALREAIAITESVPEHTLARAIQAESEFEAALAMAEGTSGSSGSVENVQQLMLAVGDYRRAADLHRDTKLYLETGQVPPARAVGSEPLLPRLYVEICRRGMHAAILAQEGMDRLGLRGDAQLIRDAQDLIQHLRSVTRPCCRDASGSRSARLLHQLKHLPDRDEASRLAILMISYRWSTWTKLVQNMLFFGLGLLVAWLGLADILPQPSSDTIRAMVLGLGVLLMLMPFARSLKVGVVELSREDEPAPLSGRSKSLRTSRLLLRVNHLGTFALPSPPEKGRRAHETARQAVPAARGEVITGEAAAVA